MQSRYYDPEWGRFVNSDALIGVTGELLGHNMFAYSKNNLVNMKDPNGFRAMRIDGDLSSGSGKSESPKKEPPNSAHIGAFDYGVGRLLDNCVDKTTTLNEIAQKSGGNHSSRRSIVRNVSKIQRSAPIQVNSASVQFANYANTVGLMNTMSYYSAAQSNYSTYREYGTGAVYAADAIDFVGVTTGVLLVAAIPVETPFLVAAGAAAGFGWAASELASGVKRWIWSE